jgi:hypothetical protein
LIFSCRVLPPHPPNKKKNRMKRKEKGKRKGKKTNGAVQEWSS